MNFQTV
nr:unnamed protein product [Callosobruchus chinensis]CAH7768157.1 unnamed protein product [Callosobruchus chinensis]